MILYNDNDEAACRWLHELVNAGAIPPGDIWCRDIREIEPHEVEPYTQVHWFAGIGGWAYALELAGWDSARPVWTGSCPCQPFSAAGKQRGHEDERHLWPAFFRLIEVCKPPVVLGEQVASKLGRRWLAGVFADLETVGYAVAGADLCAAGVGAPHIRQRLWWVADAGSTGARRHPGNGARAQTEGRGEGLADGHSGVAPESCGADGGLADAEGCDRQIPVRRRRQVEAGAKSGGRRGTGGLGDPDEPRPQGRRDDAGEYARERAPWAASLDSWLPCADGKQRRIEPGLEPLVNGLSGRVGLLRGYGNAIVPQVAAAFVQAYTEAVA